MRSIRNALAHSTSVLASAIAAAATFGCLDVRVIQVDEPDAGDAGLADVTTDGPSPCEMCLRAPPDPGPGCGHVVTICAADVPCNATMECAIAKRCIDLGAQGAIIDCGTPCARDANLDPTTPSITYILDVVTCAAATCGPICRGEVPPAGVRAR